MFHIVVSIAVQSYYFYLQKDRAISCCFFPHLEEKIHFTHVIIALACIHSYICVPFRYEIAIYTERKHTSPFDLVCCYDCGCVSLKYMLRVSFGYETLQCVYTVQQQQHIRAAMRRTKSFFSTYMHIIVHLIYSICICMNIVWSNFIFKQPSILMFSLSSCKCVLQICLRFSL